MIEPTYPKRSRFVSVFGSRSTYERSIPFEEWTMRSGATSKCLMNSSRRKAEGVTRRSTRPSAFFKSANRCTNGLLVVGGCTTSGCVRATAVDAQQLGLSVVVPHDAVFDRFELSHRVTLFDLWLKYAWVTDTDAVVSAAVPTGAER